MNGLDCQPRVAIVHYWLVGMRGGERVLERLLTLYPHADIFTHVYDPARISSEISRHSVMTTFINRIPFARKHYRIFLPLMPRALEALDLTAYDLVISSEAGPAKGVITRPDALHVCYCHSPMRYIWDLQPQYRASAGWISRAVMDLTFSGLRMWDVTSAQRVDVFAANSSFVRQRIQKYYRRDATVIWPPIEVASFVRSDEVGAQFLWVGELVAYKRPDIAIEAFNSLGLPLRVIGTGPLLRKMKRMAAPNITFEDRLPYPDLKRAYATSRALIYTAKEDFGIVPVEMMASGRPVIAYGAGGVRDTVIEGETGLFFAEQSAEQLIAAVKHFKTWEAGFDANHAIAQMKKFAARNFDSAFLNLVAVGSRL